MPNLAIDVAEAQRLYRELRSWRKVANALTPPDRATPYATDSVYNAVMKVERQLRRQSYGR